MHILEFSICQNKEEEVVRMGFKNSMMNGGYKNVRGTV